MHHTRPRKFWPKLVSLLLIQIILLLLSPPNLSAAEAEESGASAAPEQISRGSAVVYVIDKSSSMLWIFDELRENLKEAIGKRGPGDCVSIILFGDSATILASFKSMDDKKKETMSVLLDTVSPDSLYTNLGLGIRRGTESLHQYFRDGLAENYTLILVTDGKDHPSPHSVRDLTIEEALTQFPDFLPGQQWSLRYIALKGQVDPNLLALVKKYRGGFLDVDEATRSSKSTEIEIVGAFVENLEKWELLEVEIIDQMGEVRIKRGEQAWMSIPAGKRHKLSLGDQVAVEPSSKAVISIRGVGKIGLKEQTEISLESLQKMPLDQGTTVRFRLREGTLWNVVNAPSDDSLTYEVLTPIALTGVRGTIFRVSFDTELFEQSIAVIEGLTEASSLEERPTFRSFLLNDGTYSAVSQTEEPPEVRPVPIEIVREWRVWKKSLLDETPLRRIDFKLGQYKSARMCRRSRQEADGGACVPLNLLEFGPLTPGKTENQEIVLNLEEPVKSQDVEIVAMFDLKLPPGIVYRTNVNMAKLSELLVTVSVDLKVDEAARLPGNEQWRGRLILMSNDESIVFPKKGIVPVVAFTAPIELSAPPRKQVRLFSTELSTPWSLLGLIIGIPVYFVLLILAIRFVDYGDFRRRSAHLVGLLVVLERPKDFELDNIDLSDLGKASKKSVLSLGRNPEADICIPHDSVEVSHAEIRPGREGKPPPVYIMPVGVSDIKVNNFLINREVLIKDRDIVDIGAFQFLYTSSLLKQVVIHYRDGRVMYGTLLTWNIEEEGFMFQPAGKYIDELAYFAVFDHLKGVFFVKDFDTEIAKRIQVSHNLAIGSSVVINFSDGETIEGNLVGDYSPTAPRFYMAPKLEKGKEESTLFILVEKEFTSNITLCDD